MALETARTADEPSKTEVLVIGAGPAGLFAASELLRHGVKPRIVEQKPAPHHETRGTGLQPAVLEVLHRAGVIQPFLADSARIKEVELLGPGQARVGLVQFAGLGCKYEFQCSQPQWRTEGVLRDHLAGQGLQVEFGVGATSIAADGDGVTVSLDKSGRKEVVRAEYLIGAGGGHSVTRHSMEEHLDGETYGGRFIVADVRLTLPAPPGRARIIVGPSGFVLLALLPESRFLIFVNRDEDDQGAEPPSAGKLGLLLAAIPIQAFVGILLLTSSTVIGGDFYRSLALPFVPDPLADQHTAGTIAATLGEIPILVVLVVLLVQSRIWSRQASGKVRLP